jgi:hypothetical protein
MVFFKWAINIFSENRQEQLLGHTLDEDDAFGEQEVGLRSVQITLYVRFRGLPFLVVREALAWVRDI